MTGGRLKRVRHYVQDETFCMTYGDGVADVDIPALISQHKAYGRSATVTAVQPPARFGILEIGSNSSVCGFKEKPKGDGGWINGAFSFSSSMLLIESKVTIRPGRRNHCVPLLPMGN